MSADSLFLCPQCRQPLPVRPPPFYEFSNPFADGTAETRDPAELVLYTFMAGSNPGGGRPRQSKYSATSAVRSHLGRKAAFRGDGDASNRNRKVSSRAAQHRARDQDASRLADFASQCAPSARIFPSKKRAPRREIPAAIK